MTASNDNHYQLYSYYTGSNITVAHTFHCLNLEGGLLESFEGVENSLCD